MVLVVIQNIAPDPVKIGFLSAVRIMLQANCNSKPVEKFLRLWRGLIGQKKRLTFYEFRYKINARFILRRVSDNQA
jgi:hypothetical protein